MKRRSIFNELRDLGVRGEGFNESKGIDIQKIEEPSNIVSVEELRQRRAWAEKNCKNSKSAAAQLRCDFLDMKRERDYYKQICKHWEKRAGDLHIENEGLKIKLSEKNETLCTTPIEKAVETKKEADAPSIETPS